MAGRRPKPTALKRVAGNPGKRALNEKEPTPPIGVPDPPPHIVGEALAEWKRITPQLVALGILTDIDRAALAAYCQLWARWVEAEKSLSTTGTILKSPSGYPIQNPFLGVANTAIEGMRKFLGEFGMTPSSRSRITTNSADDPAKDPWAVFDKPPAAKVQ